MAHKSQSGIAHPLFILLFLAVVAVISFATWNVMQEQNDQADVDTSSKTAAKVTAPDSINSETDLNKTNTALNQANIDSEVNPDSLNSDVDSLQ
jgi:hypothetical protein